MLKPPAFGGVQSSNGRESMRRAKEAEDGSDSATQSPTVTKSAMDLKAMIRRMQRLFPEGMKTGRGVDTQMQHE